MLKFKILALAFLLEACINTNLIDQNRELKPSLSMADDSMNHIAASLELPVDLSTASKSQINSKSHRWVFMGDGGDPSVEIERLNNKRSNNLCEIVVRCFSTDNLGSGEIITSRYTGNPDIGWTQLDGAKTTKESAVEMYDQLLARWK